MTHIPAAQRDPASRSRELIAWAHKEFSPHVAMSSSFQTQSVPLLHLVAEVAPRLPIVFLDTGYHFAETLEFRDRLIERWGLNVRVMRAAMPRPDFLRHHGPDLYRRDPDLCCQIHKVEPMTRALDGLRAWISGVRRDQAPSRSDVDAVEEGAGGVVRIHPMVHWRQSDIDEFSARHDLPTHPLHAQGYASIGCAPCTRPVAIEGAYSRTGRWAGTDKTECGLHTDLRQGSNRPEGEDRPRELPRQKHGNGEP